MQRSLVIIKPDAIMRRLAGRIISRIENKGLKIVALKFIKITLTQAARLYKVHKGKPFYNNLIKFITSAPVIVMVVEAPYAIESLRMLAGETFGFKATPGTIRGDFAISKGFNLIHASDSLESALYEIPIFFKEDQIIKYKMSDRSWIAEQNEYKFNE